MEKWEDPNIASENLLSAHAAFREERVSLGGRWRFLSQSAASPAPEGWEGPEFDDRKWKRIAVPGSWETSDVCPPVGAGDSADEHLAGFYRRSFTLAKDQGSRRILLQFGAVSSCALVWVNGSCIGMAKNCPTEFEFDITSAVRPEKNVVCVQVLRSCGGTKEKPRFSGILGDVELYSLPAKAITDIQTEVNWQSSAPQLHVTLRTRNSDGFTARIALMDGNQVIGYCESPIQEDSASAVIPCKDVRLWTAETPERYRVAVILWDGVAVYHTREVSFGFRQWEVTEEASALNGQPEKLFAVACRPFGEDGCVSGTLEADLAAIKAHNFNAVSLTGFVPEELYEICDRLGLYVLAFDRIEKDPAPAAEEQLSRLALVRGNHPCVLPMEGLGILESPSVQWLEQALGNTALPEQDSGLLKRRAVQPSPSEPLSGPALLRFSEMPESLKAYVTMIRGNTGLAGGIFGPWQEGPDSREAKAVLQPVTLRFEDGVLTVENLSRFRSTASCECRYRLTRDGETVVEKPLSLDAAPGGTASTPIETKYDIYKPGRYYLTVEFRNPASGSVVAASQWPVARLKHIYDENPGGTIREDSGSILLRSQEATYVIDRASGSLEQIKLEEASLLRQAVYPVYAFPPAEAAGLRIPSEWEKLTTRKKKLKPSVFEVDHMTRAVTASFHLGSGLMQTYRLYSDGSLSVELRLRTGRTAPERLGILFPTEKKLTQLRWFGLGPDDTAPGRTDGRCFAVHTQALTENEVCKESVYTLTLADEAGQGLHVRSEDGLRVRASAAGLTLELPVSELKPHTTYTFGFVIYPTK